MSILCEKERANAIEILIKRAETDAYYFAGDFSLCQNISEVNLAAKIAAQSAATTRHPITSSILDERGVAPRTESHSGHGHLFFDLASQSGLVAGLDLLAPTTEVIVVPIGFANLAGFLAAILTFEDLVSFVD